MADVLPFPSSLDSAPPDAGARRQALDIRSSFIVEAPAGSGKTGLLIQRFLKLLADDSVTEPEQVLAVTFTNKAAAELRHRVLEHLEAAQRNDAAPANQFDRESRALALAVLERDRQLAWSLLDRPHRLNLRTIDSVCAEIARTLPVLSGSGGRLIPTTDADSLHREAARRTLLLFGGGDVDFDRALRDLLLHRDGNLADCETLLASMLSLRDQWGDLIPLTEPHLNDHYLDSVLLPRLEHALDHAICAGLTRLAQVFPADILAELTELASELGRLDGYKGDPNPLALCAGLRNSPEAITAHLGHWSALIHLLVTPSSKSWRKGFNKNHIGIEWETYHKNRLKALIDRLNHRDDLLAVLCEVDSLPPAQYPPEQWAVAKSLFRVLSRALVELQLVFAARNQCDFTEVSLLARNALGADGGAEDLASALGARLQHLLVDEMQDTSTSQYELIELLTASWDGHSQTVFLVGDPRQSIYLFRQARVERFIRAMQTRKLGDLQLTCIRLSANFRSQSNLVEQLNGDFSLIFPNESHYAADPRALPYSPAAATLPPSVVARGAVWHMRKLPPPSADQTGSEIKQRQAKRDADEILSIAREWIERPLPAGRNKPWSIAVLVRSRNHLDRIVVTLRQQSDPIPFRATDIEALTERQEILDLTALTRAVLHPADRVAALAVLRAPWCGLTLADLHTLTGADDPNFKKHSVTRLMAERGHLLPDDACQRMSRVWTVLDSAVAQRARLTTSQLVERAWRSLGGSAWLTPAQIANARRFFQLLDELETPGIRIDLTVLAQRMQHLFAEPDPIPDGTPYLELLTIHKAKGLEWDVVIVPALERKPASDRSRLLAWSEIDSADPSGDGAHIMLAPIAGRGEESKALNDWLKSIHRAREAAERKRLFYVACTRAREELHLFATPQLTSNGDLSPASESLLNAAWAAAEPHFAADAAADITVDEPEREFTIAATAGPSGRLLQRLPAAFDPSAAFAEARARRLAYSEPDGVPSSGHTPFSRPEGSFAARSFGNAIHACLDTFSDRILNGATVSALLVELPSWAPRIAAMLRADGHPRALVDKLAHEAGIVLGNALRDPHGAWILSAHSHSASEFAVTAWSDSHAENRSASIRVDRVFHAGSEPHAPGKDFLWIIDYKTIGHGTAGIDAFLAAQRAAYGPQLENYARILAPLRSKPLEAVRLALYFPTLPRLIWWNAPTESD